MVGIRELGIRDNKFQELSGTKFTFQGQSMVRENMAAVHFSIPCKPNTANRYTVHTCRKPFDFVVTALWIQAWLKFSKSLCDFLLAFFNLLCAMS